MRNKPLALTMSDDEDRDQRKQVDTVNIWWSPKISKWSVCALVRVPALDYKDEVIELLQRERTEHETLQNAMAFALESYKE